MSIFDVAMVGRLGTEALAATGMGAMMLWGALSLVLGIRTAVQTVASRRLGQKIDHEAGTAFHNGLLMATIYALPMSVAGWLWAKDIIPFFIDDPIATPLTVDYASIIFLSLLVCCVYVVSRPGDDESSTQTGCASRAPGNVHCCWVVHVL